MKYNVGSLVVAALIVFPVAAQERGADKKPAAPAVKADPARPNDDAVQLVDFKRRVESYIAIHNKAEKDAPPLKETKDPHEIVKAQEALAVKIRALRANAQPGDIFTPEIRDVFRRLLRPELKGEDGHDAKKVLKDDAPPAVPFKVNAKYPEGASRPTVPASLLGNLPQLPKEVEYRIIDKHLILLDTEAAIIVDYIINAIP